MQDDVFWTVPYFAEGILCGEYYHSPTTFLWPGLYSTVFQAGFYLLLSLVFLRLAVGQISGKEGSLRGEREKGHGTRDRGAVQE